jgi:hypothetical protein
VRALAASAGEESRTPGDAESASSKTEEAKVCKKVDMDGSTMRKSDHEMVVSLYNKILPELTTCRLERWWNSKNGAKALEARWREDGHYRSEKFWSGFFRVVRNNPHWMGNGPNGWKADLRWLLKPANFTKVIELGLDLQDKAKQAKTQHAAA